MGDFHTARLHEEDRSQSSDEKMDTGSESFRSQDTPNSALSPDFEDKCDFNVLRLQNPSDDVLRLSAPEKNDNIIKIQQKDLSDSFVTKMSHLHLESPLENRPRNLGISPPKFSSNLVCTTDHPLMVSSPSDFPDVVPKEMPKLDEKDLSLSSIEDDRPHECNGYGFYTPDINTSKNNLYFSDNFMSAESNVSNSKVDNTPPDVARVEQRRRLIIPRFVDTPPKLNNQSRTEKSPQRALGRIVDANRDENAIAKYVEERNKKMSYPVNFSTPKNNEDISSRVAQWCESTQTVRLTPNFDLPIELSTNVTVNHELGSPDVVSSSTEDKSAYQALLDPYTCSVALRPNPRRPKEHSPQNMSRRLIRLPTEDDHSSLDSVSMESEDEPPELDDERKELDHEPKELDHEADDGGESVEDNKQTKSTNTCSECSDQIPEYSAAEELHNERSWVSVNTGTSLTTCDMMVIEPFKRVLSHGGYDPQGSAIVVFSGCYLPDNGRPDYKYVMDNLFLYAMWWIDRLVGSEYILVYLHGACGARRLPALRWMHDAYKLIDRRLRKSLKQLYLVHPTFWLKSLVVLTKPFISSKFFRKLNYVRNLEQLYSLVKVEPNAIPEVVKQFDERRHR